MWNKSAKFLIVRVQIKKRWRFAIPVTLFVVDEFFEALANLAWVGEIAIKLVPIPQEEHAQKRIHWVKAISPSGVISMFRILLDDLRRHKGLDLVDVEAGEVQVKVHLK